MKKQITLILAAVLLWGLASCGVNEPKETEKGGVTPVESSGFAEETTEGADKTAETTDAGGETGDLLSETSPAEETDAPDAKGGYVCEFDNGIVIELGAAADGVLAALGTPQNVAEAPSCVHEGVDRIYSYNGFSVTTAPDGKGTDRVQEVALITDAVVLKNGVFIGASLDAVTAAFGGNYSEQFGVLQYITEQARISIVLDGDFCVSGLVITAAE